MEKLRVAVVGVGKIAQIAHLPVLKKMENVDLVAVCDVDEKKMAPIMAKFKIPKWYNVFDEMLEKEPIDALHICTTNHYHFPMALMALSKGIHVFVEKPLALNSADARKIVDLAEKNNCRVVVGMQNRFRNDVQTLKDFIANDELGDMFYLKAGWLKRWTREIQQSWQTKKQYSGGGVLIDLGIQLIDTAMYLLGMPEIRSLRLFGFSLRPEIEVEDSALAILETHSGLSMTVEISWNLHLDHDIQYTHVFGNKGSAYLNPLRIQKEMHGNFVTVTPIQEKVRDRYLKAYEKEIHHFINVIQNKENNISTAADALKIMKIIDLLYDSAEQGKEIVFEQAKETREKTGS